MSKSFRCKWVELYFGKCSFGIIYSIGSYFSKWHRIHIELGFVQLFLDLPIDSGRDECDNPEYGFVFHHDSFWIYHGLNKDWSWELPWFSWYWVRTSYLLKDQKHFVHNTKQSRLSWNFYEEDCIWKETYPYTYTLNNGTIQERTATIRVVEREWRRKWFGFSSKVRKTIDVQFNDEVGERTGSWKGGTVGCSYTIAGNETPLECLRRMEKERKF